MSSASRERRSWFFLLKRDQPSGPHNEVFLCDAMEQALITRSTLVWNPESMKYWCAIEDVPGLLPRLRRKMRGFSRITLRCDAFVNQQTKSESHRSCKEISGLLRRPSYNSSVKEFSRSSLKGKHLLREPLVLLRTHSISSRFTDDEKCGVIHPPPLEMDVSGRAQAGSDPHPSLIDTPPLPDSVHDSYSIPDSMGTSGKISSLKSGVPMLIPQTIPRSPSGFSFNTHTHSKKGTVSMDFSSVDYHVLLEEESVSLAMSSPVSHLSQSNSHSGTTKKSRKRCASPVSTVSLASSAIVTQ